MLNRFYASFVFISFLAFALIPAVNAQQEILSLASRGETQAVLTALDADTARDAVQADGTGLLHWAVYYNDLVLVNRLIQ
ncbi:hypothetical protein N8303_08260, partial [Gammaproteobacteria bacterium]|nr:hypothetical protein [Gammaproteobacteria bacterium]